MSFINYPQHEPINGKIYPDVMEDEFYLIRTADGEIRFRYGTGDNVEITLVRAADPGNGGGTRLIVEMLRWFIGNTKPPYKTVYGFTRTPNLTAQEFYRAVGFTLSPVVGVYADGTAVVFSADYNHLCRLHGVT